MKSLFLYLILTAASFDMRYFQATELSQDATSRSNGVYTGTPYLDSVAAVSIQRIPGKLKCAFYDRGGEGVAYHDSDRRNNGSGGLNKGPGYLNNFRMDEGVDISYTKFHDSIDNSLYNKVQPGVDQLYLGWTEPGEWTRYTVEIAESAEYRIGALYTSNRGGAIRLFVDNTDSTGLIDVPTTFDAKDPLAWRQWHHWNYVDSLAVIRLKRGRRVITLEVVSGGNFNFDYFEFRNSR
jgi:hypothetical protein